MSRVGGAGHTRSSSSSSSANGATSGSGAGSVAGNGNRYKAITREVLLAVCRKHFTLKTTGGSSAGRAFKGSSQLAKMEYANQHGEGYDYSSSEPQTKLETLERYLKRATHLQLDGLKLTHTFPSGELAAAAGQNPLDHVFAQAKNIRVLYLHENYLATLDDFSFCAGTLSHLYLQNNNIARMENLMQLTNLEKLYIGGNRIQMLEGFAPEVADEQQQQQQSQQNGDGSEQQQQDDRGASRHTAPPPFYLVELHMDSQSLPPNQSLQLSIPSIQALSSSLTILSLSHNQMDSDSILPISLLGRLTDLDLSHNRVDDLRVVSEMCSYLRDLTKLDLRDNPVNSGPGHTAVTHKKYRDRIIMSSQRIAMLDDKAVLDNQREYLHGLMEQRRIKRAQAAAAAGAPRELSEEERKFAALHAPPTFPYAPKVLTLRTTPVGGSGAGVNSINVGMLGGMGAGARHTLHASSSSAAFANNGAAHQPQYDQYQYQQSSPFLDDDDNLTGGGGGGGGAGGRGSDYGYEQQSHPDASQGQQPAGAANGEGTASSMTFTGDPARLNDLLQQRGLVSAFTGMAINSNAPPVAAATAESARVRRASMNSLNQAPKGWDGGRTQHAPPVLARKSSQTGSSGGSSASSSATPSRTAARSSASKPSVGK